MAKGDSSRAQQQINTQGRVAQNSQNSLMNNLAGSNQQFQQNYNQGAGANLGSYDQIMKNYQGLYNNPWGTDAAGNASGGPGGGGFTPAQITAERIGWDPTFRGSLESAIGHYGDFANTGGFSGQDIQDLRARAVSPTRAVYSNAQANLDRSRSLGGGSPNYAASAAKMARELGQAISDANVNANASIAEMVQRGKMFGASGLESAGLGGQDRSTNIDQFNSQMKMQADMANNANAAAAAASGGAAASRNAELEMATRLAALGGMTDLYGTNPALANVMGSQLLGSGNQLLAGQGLQNDLSLGLVGNQINKASVPGNFSQAINNIGNIAGIGGSLIGGFAGLGGGGRGPQPGRYPVDPYGNYGG